MVLSSKRMDPYRCGRVPRIRSTRTPCLGRRDPLEIDSDGHLTGQCIKGVPIVDTLTARQWTIPHGWREDNIHTIRHYYYPDGRWVEEELNYPYYDLCERLPDNHTRRPLIAA